MTPSCLDFLFYPFLNLAWFLKTSLDHIMLRFLRTPSAGTLEKPSDLRLANPHPQMKAFKISNTAGSRGNWKRLSDHRGASRQQAISSRARSISDWKTLLLEEQKLLRPHQFQKSLEATIKSYFRVVIGSSGFGIQQAWTQSHLPALWLQVKDNIFKPQFLSV